LDAALNRNDFRLKEILTNSLTTDEPAQTIALVKEIEPIVQKNMYGMLLFAVAVSFLFGADGSGRLLAAHQDR
jgi:hypothetical protein